MRYALGSMVLAALLFAAAARAQDATALVVDGRVTAVQTGVPLCGDMAIASWAEVAIVRRGASASQPSRIRVMVQCHSLSVGHRYELRLAPSRPQGGDWDVFSVMGAPPSDGMPLYWLLESRERSR